MKNIKALDDDDDEEVSFHILFTKSGFQYRLLHIHFTMQFMSNSLFCLFAHVYVFIRLKRSFMLLFVILHYGLSVLVQAFLNSVYKFDCKMKQFGVAICILERVIRVHFYYMKIVKLFILSTHSILEREREREREACIYIDTNLLGLIMLLQQIYNKYNRLGPISGLELIQLEQPPSNSR